jgi:hypothetical protein
MRSPMSSRPLIGRPSSPPSRPSDPSTGLPPPDIDPLGPAAARLPMSGPAPTSVLPGMAAPRRRSRTRPRILVLLAIVAGAVVGAYAALPSVVRSHLATKALTHGYLIAAREVDSSLHAIRLRDAELRPADVPGVSVKARYVTLWLQRLSIVRVEAVGVAVSADGTYTSVISALDHFRSTEDLGLGPPLASLGADDVTLVWTRPFGDTTRLEVQNAHVTLTQPGAKVAVRAPVLELETPLGVLGPYGATVTRDAEKLYAKIALEPTATATLESTMAADGTWRLELATPPLPLDRLGVPRTLAVASTVAGTFRCGAPAKGQAEAKVDLSLGGVRIAGAQGAFDMSLEGSISGDAARPMPISGGAVTLAGARAPIVGSVDVSAGSVKLDASFKTASRPCDSLRGEREQIQGQLTLDLRHVDELRLGAKPIGRCPVRWLQPSGARE